MTNIQYDRTYLGAVDRLRELLVVNDPTHEILWDGATVTFYELVERVCTMTQSDHTASVHIADSECSMVGITLESYGNITFTIRRVHEHTAEVLSLLSALYYELHDDPDVE